MRNLTIKNKLLGFTAFLLFGLTFQSCNKDGIPADVLDLLPREFYDELVDNGFIFNLGETPPNVEEIYLFEPENEYDNSGVFSPGQTASDAKFKIEDQVGNALTILIKGWAAPGIIDSSNATIIKGEGDKFTIVAQAYGDISGNTYIYDYVLTGELKNNGIKDAQLAFVMIENNDAFGVATEGTIRIFKDIDDIASITDTFRQAATNDKEDAKGMLAQ